MPRVSCRNCDFKVERPYFRLKMYLAEVINKRIPHLF